MGCQNNRSASVTSPRLLGSPNRPFGHFSPPRGEWTARGMGLVTCHAEGGMRSLLYCPPSPSLEAGPRIANVTITLDVADNGPG